MIAEFDFKGSTVLVTGASGFLGCVLSSAVATAGADVVRIDKFRPNAGRAIDISKECEVEELVADLASMGIKLDGIVNNAAVNHKGYDISEEQFDSTTDVNLKGTHNIIKLCAPIMSQNASVVNIASIYGVIAPDPRLYSHQEDLYSSAAYGITKAGIIQMTRYYAAHYSGTRFNSVSPGGIWQNQTQGFYDTYSSKVPMSRMAQVDEIVQPIMFLLSDMSSYMNGHNLVVDGGMSAW